MHYAYAYLLYTRLYVEAVVSCERCIPAGGADSDVCGGL